MNGCLLLFNKYAPPSPPEKISITHYYKNIFLILIIQKQHFFHNLFLDHNFIEPHNHEKTQPPD